uniref:Uncharacterized protein n=1 Tax=Cacopsylla melanoneura TaxID=428564 RepID=A0A8D9E962_9HEMI
MVFYDGGILHSGIYQTQYYLPSLVLASSFIPPFLASFILFLSFSSYSSLHFFLPTSLILRRLERAREFFKSCKSLCLFLLRCLPQKGSDNTLNTVMYDVIGNVEAEIHSYLAHII